VTEPIASRESTARSAMRLDRYLGGGRVVRRSGESVSVVLEEGSQVSATLALTFPYRPALGDSLLVLGDASAFWAIGVLEARGRVSLSNPLGLTLEASGGSLRIVGDQGVAFLGREIRLSSEQLRRAAVVAKQSLGELATEVREQLRVEAADVDESSRGRWLVRAKSFVLKTVRGARLKSAAVRLG
jgi:hypothetical protein